MSRNTINGLLWDAAQAICDGNIYGAKRFAIAALRLATLDQSIPTAKLAAVRHAARCVGVL